MPPRWLTCAAVALPLVSGAVAGAQTTVAIDGPPPPVAPAVMTTDSAGRKTIRAIRLSEPLKLDGVLDEAVYQNEKSFDGMIQSAPDFGQAASERSDIWIMYDDRNVYVTCRCYDRSPAGEWILNELRRDTDGLRNNENFGVMFDTFHDHRSGFLFYTNPLGARADYSVVDEGGPNKDWNPVWTSAPGRFDGGWTVEMAIPFKSIRYRAGEDQAWGIQIRRGIRHRNEWDYLTPTPRVLAGPQAFNRISAGGTLVGLNLPEAGKNIELKPYMIARSTTDNVRVPPTKDVAAADAGGDIKYSITPNLTADLTFNTDFAQVEVDEQQVNLTRFSLFFPEKRDFFLEGRGIFDFARGGAGAGGGGSFSSPDLPYLFYTRRIGLNNGAVVPISAGGRITGKLGPWAVGAMDIQTRGTDSVRSPATNFSVLRIKRDVLARSSVGVMATNRSVGESGSGTNTAYGADASFGLTDALQASAYWAQTNTTDTTNVSGDNQSYQALVDYGDDTYGAHADYLAVGANFDPQIGFRRRTDFGRSYASLRYSPRPTAYLPSVRKFTWWGDVEYIEDGVGAVDTRGYTGSFETEFESSDQLTFTYHSNYEFIRTAFTPSGSPAPISVGGYAYNSGSIEYQIGAQRRVSGTLRVEGGQYYDGTIQSVTFGSGFGGFNGSRVTVTSRLAVEPSFSYTAVERPAGSFITRLARTRVNYAFSPLMFVSALVQYNSADNSVSSNLRFRWEYAPGSELFLVYTDERDTTPDLYATPTTVRGLKNRAFVVKINRLFRY